MRFVTMAVLIALAANSRAQDRPQDKKKKNDKEPLTQTLPLLQDPPAAAVGETNRLIFRVSPISNKGLLAQQVRDALKILLQENRGGSVIKLRAFVAGSGDLRRVQTIVSEVFTDHKLSIPALSTIQVGALSIEGAQVVIESVAVDKKVVNPNGLAFFSGQQAKTVAESAKQLRSAVDSAGVASEAVLRTTCFLSSLDDLAAARSAISAAFPSAAANFVQSQRLALEQLTECEAVGRLDKSPGADVKLVNPPGLASNPNYSQIALVGAPKIVFSGLQMAFGNQDKDVRLSFDRLRKALESQGSDDKHVFYSHVYPMTKTIADTVRGIRFDYFDRSHPPASTLLLFEGLPSLDTTVGIEVAAAAH